MHERRNDNRVAVELGGILRAGNQLLNVVVKDMSASGALIAGVDRLPHGAPLTLRIDKLGAFDCKQKRWSEDGSIGLRFFVVHGGIYYSLKRLNRYSPGSLRLS